MFLMKNVFRITLIVIVFLSLKSGLIYALEPVNPIAVGGYLDLSHQDFESNKLLNLDGEWEFYWNALITPDDFVTGASKKTEFIKVPGFWNRYFGNKEIYPGVGFATFRLQIKLPKTRQILAIKLPLMHSSYTLWANGHIVLSNGIIGKTRETTVPQFLPLSTPLLSADSQLELVLQVANFSHINGGIQHSLQLGPITVVKKIEDRRIVIDLFLIGAIFIIGLYHFGLFALRKSEVSPLAFGLFCLVISLRISLHGYILILSFFPSASGEFLAKLDYFTLYFGIMSILYFLKLLYPQAFSKNIFNGFTTVFIGFTIFTTITPAVVFTGYKLYFLGTIGIACIYLIYVLIRSIIDKREGARLVFVGFLVIFLTFINDALFYEGVVNTTDMVGTGMFIFIFTQSLVLSFRFSKAFHTIEVLSHDLEQKVQERTASIKDLLDNTGQGFLSFNRDYQIQKYTSQATRLFFNQTIEHTNVLDLMFSDDRDSTKEALDLIFNNPNSLAMVKSLIPTELIRDQKIYKIDYRWIKRNNQQEGRIMMVLSDITIERALERKLKKDEEQNTIIVKIAVDRHGFIDFLEDINRIIHAVLKNLSLPLDKINVNDLFRYFHTIKGGMASYAFHEIAEKANAVESRLAPFRDQKKELDTGDLQVVKNSTVEIQLLLSKKLEKLNFLLPKELLEASKTNYFRIPESKISILENAIKSKNSDLTSIKALVNDLRKQPVRNVLKKFATDIKEMAEKLRKNIEVKIEGETTEIVHEPLKQLFSALIHLVRNSVDHGIESPEIRIENQKPEQGQIQLKFKRSDQYLNFILSDDGTGIDAEKIGNLALEKGIITQSELDQLSDQEKIKLIFTPGLSTNQEVTDISGRGVGMDAVLNEINRLDGTIHIETKKGKGSVFIISIPEKKD